METPYILSFMFREKKRTYEMNRWEAVNYIVLQFKKFQGWSKKEREIAKPGF